MRPHVALGLGLLALLPVLASAGPAPVDSRAIVGFDRQPETWLITARTRLLPIAGPTPVWSIRGRIGCQGDACPRRGARIRGVVLAPGGVLQATARFAGGTRCTFAGSLDDPAAAGEYVCTDRDRGITLHRAIHVGLCRCGARDGADDAFCATRPCPGPF